VLVPVGEQLGVVGRAPSPHDRIALEVDVDPAARALVEQLLVRRDRHRIGSRRWSIGWNPCRLEGTSRPRFTRAVSSRFGGRRMQTKNRDRGGDEYERRQPCGTKTPGLCKSVGKPGPVTSERRESSEHCSRCPCDLL